MENKRHRGVSGKIELYAYIRPSTKIWLKREAKKQNKTVSRLVEELLTDIRKRK